MTVPTPPWWITAIYHFLLYAGVLGLVYMLANLLVALIWGGESTDE